MVCEGGVATRKWVASFVGVWWNGIVCILVLSRLCGFGGIVCALLEMEPCLHLF